MKKFIKNFKNISNVKYAFFALLTTFSQVAFSAGLDDGTAELENIRVWLYGALGLVAFIYLIWTIMQAFTEKKQWGDVVEALVKVAVAGAAVVLGDWGWSVWGS